MDKKVLAIYYSQSGQMTDIIRSLTGPLEAAGAEVEIVRVHLRKDFPFPWTGKRFFSVMPDCVLGVPAPLDVPLFRRKRYDLVIFGYQPWFLSPSIPSNSLLEEPAFRALLEGTPVVTVSEARNMWLSAYRIVRQKLSACGARLAGNIALVDRHANFISFVTIFYWMLSGKKERYLHIFPKPGVADADIAHCAVYGQAITRALEKDDWQSLQEELLANGAVRVKYPLMLMEGKARILFRIWAKFISGKQNRGPWLTVFKYYLFAALFLGAPILITLDAIFVRPFSARRIRAKISGYLQVS